MKMVPKWLLGLLILLSEAPAAPAVRVIKRSGGQLRSLLSVANSDIEEADDDDDGDSGAGLNAVAPLEVDGEAAPNLQAAIHDANDGASLQSTITLLVQEREEQDRKLRKALTTAQALKKLAEQAITKKNQMEGAKAAEEKLFQVTKADLESQLSGAQDKTATLEEMVAGLKVKASRKVAVDGSWKKEKATLLAAVKAEKRELVSEKRLLANRTRTLHQMTGAAAKLRDYAMKFRAAEAKAEKEKASVAQLAARQKAALEAYIRQQQGLLDQKANSESKAQKELDNQKDESEIREAAFEQKLEESEKRNAALQAALKASQAALAQARTGNLAVQQVEQSRNAKEAQDAATRASFEAEAVNSLKKKQVQAQRIMKKQQEMILAMKKRDELLLKALAQEREMNDPNQVVNMVKEVEAKDEQQEAQVKPVAQKAQAPKATPSPPAPQVSVPAAQALPRAMPPTAAPAADEAIQVPQASEAAKVIGFASPTAALQDVLTAQDDDAAQDSEAPSTPMQSEEASPPVEQATLQAKLQKDFNLIGDNTAAKAQQKQPQQADMSEFSALASELSEHLSQHKGEGEDDGQEGDGDDAAASA